MEVSNVRALARTPQERAKFEVPGQRFALARSGETAVAILTLDTYGWSGLSDRKALHLGHSLLRSPMWPHADADAGIQQLSYALAPLSGGSIAEVEQLWRRFAGQVEHRLFTTGDLAVGIVACKPAQDGDGVVVRLRECNGAALTARVGCAHQMRAIEKVDGLERSLGAVDTNDGLSFETVLRPFQLQSFRVRF